MSAQPDHAPPTPHAPAPGAPAELRAQLRADRRAKTWVPAFERDWAKALDDARHTFSLTPCTRSSAPGNCAPPPPGTSTPSWTRDKTTPTSWTSTTSSAAARDRAAVGGAPVPAGRQVTHGAPRPRP